MEPTIIELVSLIDGLYASAAPLSLGDVPAPRRLVTLAEAQEEADRGGIAAILVVEPGDDGGEAADVVALALTAIPRPGRLRQELLLVEAGDEGPRPGRIITMLDGKPLPARFFVKAAR